MKPEAVQQKESEKNLRKDVNELALFLQSYHSSFLGVL